MTIQTTDNKYGVAKWIVDSTPGLGTHTTINSAIISASSGDTVFVRAGTYTEDVALKLGVTLTAFGGDQLTPTVTIVGKCTYSTDGRTVISNIRLQTNGDYCLQITGSAPFVLLENVYFNCTNNTGIQFAASSANAVLNILNCRGSIGMAGIAWFLNSGSGRMGVRNTLISNGAGSTTANSTSVAGVFDSGHSSYSNPFSFAGTSTGTSFSSSYASGSASAITIGAGTTFTSSNDTVNSSNAAAITGAGTINYNAISFSGTSSNINTTTQNVLSIGPSATVGSANSGATNTLTVNNTSNTASSGANLQITVGGGTAGDAQTTYTVTGGSSWSTGIDNSDSDAWVLNPSATMGSTENYIKVYTTGEINYPRQPCFLATANVQSNVTGDGIAYTILYANEIFDQGNDFTSPNFQAPVTGRYLFTFTTDLAGLVAGNTSGNSSLVTSNRTYPSFGCNWGNFRNAVGAARASASVIADMDALDTAYVDVTINGGARVTGISATGTSFSGSLLT